MLTVLHPWHGVSPGDSAPRIVNAVIEIPKGSRAKYEIDKASGLLKLDRVIYSSFMYPINYGFIPQTLGDDKDPLDILVLSSISVQPLCLMEARILGVMQMVDHGDATECPVRSITHVCRNPADLQTCGFTELTPRPRCLQDA